jgi:hypothetical protein
MNPFPAVVVPPSSSGCRQTSFFFPSVQETLWERSVSVGDRASFIHKQRLQTQTSTACPQIERQKTINLFSEKAFHLMTQSTCSTIFKKREQNSRLTHFICLKIAQSAQREIYISGSQNRKPKSLPPA